MECESESEFEMCSEIVLEEEQEGGAGGEEVAAALYRYY
jgi:hypothetical protein